VRGKPNFLLVYFGQFTSTFSECTNMALTDVKVRALKGKDAPYKVSDSEGLYVLVPPNGSKLWRLTYRYLGKQKTLVLGRYPALKFLDARRARDDAKRMLAQGEDPSGVHRAEKRKRKLAAGNTFACQLIAKSRRLDLLSFGTQSDGSHMPTSTPQLGIPPKTLN
jgi:hypothetical protein